MRKKGKVNRFHPESSCWFNKDENSNSRDKSQVKFVNSTEIESELLDAEQKTCNSTINQNKITVARQNRIDGNI